LPAVGGARRAAVARDRLMPLAKGDRAPTGEHWLLADMLGRDIKGQTAGNPSALPE